jgi:hypothetical protein
MENTLHKIVDCIRIDLTAEEIAEREAFAASYVPPTQPAPTKEQLLAELQALTAKINALG